MAGSHASLSSYVIIISKAIIKGFPTGKRWLDEIKENLDTMGNVD